MLISPGQEKLLACRPYTDRSTETSLFQFKCCYVDLSALEEMTEIKNLIQSKGQAFVLLPS